MFKPMPGTFNGYRLLSNGNLTEVDTAIVNRTWGERLFSWPWKPRKKTKEIEVMVPSKQVYTNHSNMTMTAHPVMIAELEKLLKESG